MSKKFKDTLFWKVVKNKYFIACFVFLLVIFFFDDNSIIEIRKLKKDVAELDHTIDTMRQGIYEDSLQVERLRGNMDSIERYGRENYYMKRENEDVYVVNKNTSKL